MIDNKKDILPMSIGICIGGMITMLITKNPAILFIGLGVFIASTIRVIEKDNGNPNPEVDFEG